MGQFDPLAPAFRVIRVAVAGIEFGHIQRAVIEDVAVGFLIAMVDAVAADEFVDEFATLVVAHVHHSATIVGLGQCGVFMFEAAQRGAFDRSRLRIERIDLDHPAVTVELVGILGHVEARVVRVPVDVLAAGDNAVALLRGIELLLGVAAAEAVGEVFFAGQVGAPRCLAVGAVLEGAEDFFAVLVGGGFHQVVAAGRTADAQRRVTVNPTVVARALDELPLAVLALHFDHRHAFAGQCLAHILSRLRHAAMRIQVAIVGVFVVDRHQRAVLVVREGEQAHAVIVVAELHFLCGSGAVTARIEGRAVLVQRLAPTDQHRRLVALGQADGVGGRRRNALETEQTAVAGADAGGHDAAAQQVAAEEHRRAAQGTGADETATAEADHFFQISGLVFF